MPEYFLKNETGSDVTINDLGIMIADGQSITIDQNDFDGFLTLDLTNSLNDLESTDPSYPNGLVLSETDVGDDTGDFNKVIAIERLTLYSKWKPKVASFGDLPLVGNDDGDLRLVGDENVIYRWEGPPSSQWTQITSTFSLTVTEYDHDPLGTNIEKLVFVQPEDDVFIDDLTHTAYIGTPDAPGPLTGTDLIFLDASFYTGRLSQSNSNYKTGEGPGTSVDYIINTDVTSFRIQTEGTNHSNYGDRGLVTVYFNGSAIGTVDLGANFDESNRDGSQDISTYDTQGSGDPIVDGVVDFVGTGAGYGNIEVLGVSKANNFPHYQIWQIEINVTDVASMLRQGYNSFYVEHSGLGTGTQTSNTLDIFYDTDTGADPLVNAVVITEDTPQYYWLSGVKYYGEDSSWYLDFSVQNGFNNVYHVSNAPVTVSNWPGLPNTPITYNASSVSGVSTPPDIGETMAITNYQIIQASGQSAMSARATITPRDPYGSYTPEQTDDNNYMIFSYDPASTPLKEYFRDENYRLLDGAYDTIPVTITGQWDSTQSLVTYDGTNGLQLFDDKLVFPVDDFSDDLPSGNPDYSVLAADINKIYIRAFKDTTLTRASGILRMTGINKTQLHNQDLKVWIKAPSQTGWLALHIDYNYATFTGIDGDGCWINRDIQSGSDFQFTLDKFRTEDSGYMIIVKVEYPDNSAPHIQYMEITNWG